MAAENIAIYEQVKAAYRRDRNAAIKVVVRFGSEGEQFAATRFGRNYVSRRAWRPSSKSWTKWRKLEAGEVLRIATQADRDYFKPDFGPPWEAD